MYLWQLDYLSTSIIFAFSNKTYDIGIQGSTLSKPELQINDMILYICTCYKYTYYANT